LRNVVARIVHRYVFSAKGAAFHHQPGAALQVLSHPERASAESAIHVRYNPMIRRLKRAFSACLHGNLNSWGDAPGSRETAPMALKA
jgi:hypothetical protein